MGLNAHADAQECEAGRDAEMSEKPRTPEEVVGAMSYDELRELLADLRLDSTPASAVRMKRLVRELGCLEAAIEALGGPPSMRDAA